MNRYYIAIMNSPYSLEALKALLIRQKVATLPEIQSALGSAASRTAFRKLKSLSYLSSYSHAGKYYTLPEIAQFNEQGLWWWKRILFSKHRTLKRTLEAWVRGAKSGYFEPELARRLKVSVRGTLLELLQEDRIARQKVSGRYLYCSPQPSVRLQQTAARRSQEGYEPSGPEVLQHEIRAAIVLFASLLDEKQRRLYAGLESLKAGKGGDAWIAELLSLNPATISRGRRELLSGEVVGDRVRKQGGGRKPFEKKRRT